MYLGIETVELGFETINRSINRIDNVEKQRNGISDNMLLLLHKNKGLKANIATTSMVSLAERYFENKIKRQIKKNPKHKMLTVFNAIRLRPKIWKTGAINKGKPHGYVFGPMRLEDSTILKVF